MHLKYWPGNFLFDMFELGAKSNADRKTDTVYYDTLFCAVANERLRAIVGSFFFVGGGATDCNGYYDINMCLVSASVLVCCMLVLSSLTLKLVTINNIFFALMCECVPCAPIILSV